MAENFTFAYDASGDNTPPALHEFPIAAAQTVVVGDLMVVSSNQVVKASASIAEVIGVMAEDSDGVAAGTNVRLYVINRNQVWKAIADADASGAVLGNLTYDINTNQTVDVGDASNGCIQIVKLGDTNTEVFVSFSATRFG